MSSHQIIKKGPVIDRYENRPIYEYLVYSDGRVIEFAPGWCTGRPMQGATLAADISLRNRHIWRHRWSA